MRPDEKGKIKRHLPELVFFALFIGCIWFLYGIQGNAQDVASRGRSALLWMVSRWEGCGGDLSFGWIIPLVSAFVIWQKRKDLAAAPKQTDATGLIIIVLSLLLHWLGYRAQLTRLSLLSLIGLLWGVFFTLHGRQVAKLLVFPCAYLVFCIPLSFLNNITVPLRILASSISTDLLNGLGIGAVRSGTIIHSLAAGGFNFDVADACSGLRSLLAMTALTAVYAYQTQKKLWQQWMLFVAAIPLAIVGNIFRILTIALVAQGFGQERAMTMYHYLSGFLVFAVAILLMIGLGELLKINYVEKLKKWKAKNINTMSPSSV